MEKAQLCKSVTTKGYMCKKPPIKGKLYCKSHLQKFKMPDIKTKLEEEKINQVGTKLKEEKINQVGTKLKEEKINQVGTKFEEEKINQVGTKLEEEKINQVGTKLEEEKTISKYNSDCPFCLCDETDFILSCDHNVHIECCKGMSNLICPICLKNITNMPKDIQKLILKTNKRFKKEKLKEETQQIRDDFENELRNIYPFQGLNSDQDQITKAIEELKTMGVPPILMPQIIQIPILPATVIEDFISKKIVHTTLTNIRNIYKEKYGDVLYDYSLRILNGEFENEHYNVRIIYF